VCEGLDRAWRFLNAMIKTLVPDNMKAIVKDADALNPVLVAAFLDYAQARGIFVDPARVSPKNKPRVENQVPFVRESCFDGETFADLDDARQRAEHWCREVAEMRVHGTTRKVPRELFESVERAAMLAPPIEPFDVPRWIDDAKAHPDRHVQVACALYSEPTLYLHKQVRVRADKTSVRIYFGTALIKVHPRLPPGGRSTDANDYPVGKRGTLCGALRPSWPRPKTRACTSARSLSDCLDDRWPGRACVRRTPSSASCRAAGSSQKCYVNFPRIGPLSPRFAAVTSSSPARVGSGW